MPGGQDKRAGILIVELGECGRKPLLGAAKDDVVLGGEDESAAEFVGPQLAAAIAVAGARREG